jgi:hypothetical protein
MVYVGLTNDLARRRAEHGNPPDWRGFQPFASETAARAWERSWLAQSGYTGGGGGTGWRYGYMYTVTPFTRQ